MKILDIEKWNRKEHYLFFKDFNSPFFNITAPVDVTELYHFSKAKKLKFFLTSLFYATQAANKVENFRYRQRNNQVVIHDKVHPSSTVLYDNNTFGFSYFEYSPYVEVFCKKAQNQMDEMNIEKSFLPKDFKDDVLHFTTIPWVPISSMQHARRFGMEDTIPKITFGKYYKTQNKLFMPVSVEVNHSMMDGYHVGLYYQTFQEIINKLTF